jgi:KDO2-lipid IV(A) lauroyltransferase
MEIFLNSEIGLNIGLTIASCTPPWLGHVLTHMIARIINLNKDSPTVQGVRMNQKVIAGTEVDQRVINQLVLNVFRNSARSFYDLYHHLGNLEGAGNRFIVEPSFQKIIDWPKLERRGLVVAGLHLSGFDLAFQWLCSGLIKPLGITIPDPQGGRAMEFQRRLELGIDLVPGDFSGLRQAIRHLKQGGIVATGIDRPNPEYTPNPSFFGKPALLPTHHIFLAVKAGVPIIVASSSMEPTGYYNLRASDPVEMETHHDREFQLVNNAERILVIAGEFILRDPTQWLITQPVWEINNE